MKSVELQGTLRDLKGKKASKSLRAQENVPCVIYGNGENNFFYASESQLRLIIYTPNVYIILLDLNGKKYKAIIQDIQFHPVTDKAIHIDFLEVTDTKKVVVNLQVQTTGNSPGVKEGGKLTIDKKRLKVKAFVKDLPDAVVVDITPLGMGKTIRISDLNFDNVEFVEPASMPVVSVKTTRAAKEVTETPAKK